ncbi:hypothetical protein Motto_59 [Pseudomonas phage Motto]|nr:hypothetical protein Motto_59 [Pseudomonas phage Motto]
MLSEKQIENIVEAIKVMSEGNEISKAEWEHIKMRVDTRLARVYGDGFDNRFPVGSAAFSQAVNGLANNGVKFSVEYE